MKKVFKETSLLYPQKNFFKNEGHQCFFVVHRHPYFELLLTSALSFKPGWIPSL